MVVVGLPFLAVRVAQAQPTESSVSIQPGEIQWKPFTAPGIEIAWLRGGPTMAGPYAFRLRMAAGIHSAAHFHPDERAATVLSGTIYLGYGDEFDAAKAKAYPTGSFYVIPPMARHFIWAKDSETVVQEFGFAPTGTSPAKTL
jgi:hypothetical protein